MSATGGGPAGRRSDDLTSQEGGNGLTFGEAQPVGGIIIDLKAYPVMKKLMKSLF
jgi:hypothetical protein